MLDNEHLREGCEVAEASGAAAAPSWTAAASLAPALLLAACGDSGGGASPTTTSTATAPVVVTAQAVTPTQASRFLGQATMGGTKAMVADVVSKGFDGWLTAQFAVARTTTHWDWLVANGYNAVANINSEAGFDATMWRGMISDPDQLRQRVAMAMLDYLVVGIDGTNIGWRTFAAAGYVDVLLNNAFTNYRTILDAITYNAGMATFVTYLNNRKANASTGSQPDENYARELMQLFTLGLYKLNIDGTTAGSTPTETYTQADVSGLARVFTGLSLAGSTTTAPDNIRLPLVMNASINETGSASFLGATVSGGGTAAIKVALDTIFAHQNVPPFVSKQLIQRLVTSNPSAAYVGRVATVFTNNGSGVRGDMQAVIRAILLDTEARSDAGLTSTMAGKLREPVMRMTGWARAFNVTSPSAAWAVGDTSSTTTRLGQAMGRSQTVFGWFRPGYTPPDTSIAAAGLVAPEFQITNEQTTVAYVNYMQALVQNGTGDVKADYTDILTSASDSGTLVDQVNLILAGGQLSATTVTSIRAAVDSISASTAAGLSNRVYTAILLTLASPDYLTAK